MRDKQIAVRTEEFINESGEKSMQGLGNTEDQLEEKSNRMVGA